MNSLQKDMMMLAKLTHELSKKHGGIYVSACCCALHDISTATFGKELDHIVYYADEDRFVQNEMEIKRRVFK